MLQRKRSASENECHTSHSVSHTAERGDENMRSTVWLFPLRFYRRPRAPSPNSAGRWKKIAANLKSIFCSIRYSKPSTFFEGSYSFWFGNSRFKICDEWPFRYFKIFQSLSLQDATRHRMINHCDQTSGRFRELRGWTFDLTSNCHRCWGIAPWQPAWWHRAVHRVYQISQSAFAKPRHSPGLNSFSRSGRPFGYAKEQHRLLGVH